MNPCYKCKERQVGCHDTCTIPERVAYVEMQHRTAENKKKESLLDKAITAKETTRFKKSNIQW